MDDGDLSPLAAGAFLEDDGSDEADAGPTLRRILDDLATEFSDVDRREEADGTAYEVRGRAFAIVAAAGDRAEFWLRPEIAAAAARTPDARSSLRGADWVAFTPGEIDQHALDRVQAWFELGHRLAADPSAGRARQG
jgi:hypothetical protein